LTSYRPAYRANLIIAYVSGPICLIAGIFTLRKVWRDARFFETVVVISLCITNSIVITVSAVCSSLFFGEFFNEGSAVISDKAILIIINVFLFDQTMILLSDYTLAVKYLRSSLLLYSQNGAAFLRYFHVLLLLCFIGLELYCWILCTKLTSALNFDEIMCLIVQQDS
jgi:hypothetical protein